MINTKYQKCIIDYDRISYVLRQIVYYMYIPENLGWWWKMSEQILSEDKVCTESVHNSVDCRTGKCHNRKSQYGTICHPCQWDRVRSAALGAHYAALGPHYAARGP